ncbi:MAG: SIS domain-containing protein [Erysipelotrichaceae bacterium]|nr:SIS domain-containing protein [Erysipelotrichaceae bacterium]
MKETVKLVLDELTERYPRLEACRKEIEDAYLLLEEAYDHGKKLLIAGNGGSAADSEHIAGELMKRFKYSRPVTEEFAQKMIVIDAIRGEKLAKGLERPLRAVPLTSHIGLMTAYMNDVDAQGVYAQQVLGYGDEGDVFLAISTSGNSENIVNACVAAKALGLKIIALTGSKQCLLQNYADVCIQVPESETFKVQELHLPVYHCLCLMLETNYFGK